MTHYNDSSPVIDFAKGIFQFIAMSAFGVVLVIYYFTGWTIDQQMLPFMYALEYTLLAGVWVHEFIQRTQSGPLILAGIVFSLAFFFIVNPGRFSRIQLLLFAFAGMVFFRILPVIIVAWMLLLALARGASQ